MIEFKVGDKIRALKSDVSVVLEGTVYFRKGDIGRVVNGSFVDSDGNVRY